MTDDNLALERDEEKVRRVLILTGGGDAPGINAVISAFVKTATELGVKVYASEDGFAGLISEPSRVAKLTPADVEGVIAKGGCILGCSDRSNPFAYEVTSADGGVRTIDISERVMAKLDEREIDILVLVGGDGTLEIGMRFAKMGVAVVAIPKTIDNDLGATDVSFGLDTAVQTATRAIDALRSVSEPHHQVAIVEVSGHDAGWIALMSGIAGDADVVLIPEIPYDLDRVVERLESSPTSGRNLDVIVIAEGSKPLGGTVSNITAAHESSAQRQDASGAQLARLLEGRIGHEVRVTTLGHLQRGGSPTSFDRLLGARFGVHAAELCYHDSIGHMVTLRGQDIVSVPLEAAVGNIKRVPPDGELAAVARSLGIELGQE